MTLRHDAPLREADPVVAGLVDRELARQRHGLELIASENFASRAVIEAAGTPLTNKYAEGYPGRRYYGGCEVVDEVEQLAIDRAKQLFGAAHANVQPHSGAQANFAAFMAVLRPGEPLLGMSLPHGGHLSHGASVNHSGVVWRATHYGVNPATGRIDYDAVRDQARRELPRLIVAGGSAYSRIIDFATFRAIADEVGASLLVDMAHFAGLVAGGVHPSSIAATRRACRPPSNPVSSQVRRMATASSSDTNRAGSTSTLASLCSRASRATSSFHATAARTPATRRSRSTRTHRLGRRGRAPGGARSSRAWDRCAPSRGGSDPAAASSAPPSR